MRDRALHTLEVSYTASPGGQVQELYSDVSQRDLWFVWSTPPSAKYTHVSDVYTNDAVSGDSTTQEHWKYGYTGDQLTSVCDTASHCTTYSYKAGSQYPNAVLDSAPSSYWRLADSSGTAAASSVLANEQSDAGTYSNVTLGSLAGTGPFAAYGNTATAAAFNGSSSSVALPNGLLLGQTYPSIALWFNTKTAGPLFCVQNTTLTTSPGNAMCPLYVGSDGYLHGAFYTGSNTGIIGNKTVTDGAWHLAVLSGSATTQSLYLDDSLVGSLSGTINNLSMSYGYLGAVYSKPGWAGAPSTTGDWYFTGQIADVAFYKRGLTATEAGNLHTIGTSSASLLQKITKPTTAVAAQVRYDMASGRVQSVTDQNGGTWGISAPTLTGSSQVFRSAVLGAAPRAYWRLADSGATTATDEINSFTGAYNDVALGASSVFSDVTAGTFGGSDSYVKASGTVLNTSTGFSVSAWANLATANGFEDVVSQDSAQNSAFELQYDATSKTWAFSRSAADTSGAAVIKAVDTTAVKTGTWYLLTGTYDPSSGKMSLYVNGSLVATATDTTPYASTGSLEIGRGQYQSAAGEYFNGTIGDIAAYQAALDPQQVANLYGSAKNSTGIAPVQTVTVTDPKNKTLTYRFDPDNGYRMIASTDGRGYTTTYGYDTGGFLHTTTDPNGNVTTTDHDVRGNMVSETTCQVTAANACSTQYWTYYPDDTTAILTTTSGENDLPLTHSDGRSDSATDTTYQTTYVYDSNGNRKQVTTPAVTGYPSGRTTTTTYTDGTSVPVYGSTTIYAPAGLPYQVTTPGGAVTTTQYYGNGEVARVTDPLGQTTTYYYDLLGRVTSKTVGWSATYAGTNTASTAVTSYTYYTDGLLHTETDPIVRDAVTGYSHQKVTTYSYNADGDTTQISVSDAGTGADAARTTTMTHLNGLTASVTDWKGGKTSYTYDVYGNKASVTDPVGNETDYNYDADGHLLTTVLKNYTGDPVNPTPPSDLTRESRAYDPAGRLASVTDAMGRTTKYTYTDNNLTATVTKFDPTGTPSFTTESDSYDGAGNLTKKITNGGVTETDYTLDAADRIQATTLDPQSIDRIATDTYTADDKIDTATVSAGWHSIVTKYGYDAGGNVLSKAVSGDGTTRTSTWTRDTRGQAETMTDPMSNTTTYFNDALGQQVEIDQPTVSTGTFSLSTMTYTPLSASPTNLIGYNTFGEKAETQDPVGNVTRYAYLGSTETITGQPYTPIGSSTPITPVETKTHDADGRLQSDATPLNETTTYTYDQLGDLSKTIDPLGGVTHATYDTDKEKLTSTSPAGTVTGATYDFMGRALTTSVVETALSATLETDYSYGPGGWLALQTSPAGVKASYTYDNLGEKLTSTDGASNTTSYAYDGLGHLAKITAADGTYSTSSYDTLGDVTGTAAYDASGTLLESTSAQYDRNGRKTSSTDARGYQTTYGYDHTGLLQSVTQPVTSSTSITVTFGYDLAGRKTQQTDGNLNSRYWVYNSLGQVDASVVPSVDGSVVPGEGTYTNAATRATTYVYDADGQVQSETLPGGVSQQFTYDANGNLKTQSGTGAVATTATRCFTYDPDGRTLSAATSTTSSTCASTDTNETFTYDSEGALLSATGSAGSSSFTYTRDALMASRTDASGTTSYSYDSDRLSTLSDPLTGTAATASYTYNALNQVSKITYGAGGDARSYTYDALHRVTLDKLSTSGGTQVKAISYGYDADSELTSKVDVAGVTNAYTYDQAGRLTGWSNGTTSTSYGYDAASNRTNITTTTISTGAVTSNVTNKYDARDELYAASDSVKSTSAAYSYTARGTLSNASTTTGTGTTSTAYSFDAYGQNTAAGSTAYTYDALDRVTTAGSVTLLYSGTGDQVASDNAVALYSHDPDGQVYGIKFTATGSSTLAWTDQHQDLTARFTPTATGLTASTTYDPLGNTLSTSGTQIAIGYQSGYTNGGQVNMAARWYSPATGQFTSADTIETSPVPDTAGGNPYGYANASPLNGTDPTGHSTISGDGDGAVCKPYWAPECVFLNVITNNDTTHSGDTCPTNPDGNSCDPEWMCQNDFGSCAFDNWWTYSNPYNGSDPCQGLSGPACAQRNPTLAPPPGTGPGLYVPSCDAACEAAKWLAHIKELSKLGRTTIDFAVGAAADAGAAANSIASAVASTAISLGIGLATVLTDGPGGSTDTREKETDPCDQGPTITAIGIYLPMQSVPGHPGECRATGADVTVSLADYVSSEDRGSITAPDPAGYDRLPPKNRARGHLIASVIGGSNSDPRNFVAQYQGANNLMYQLVERNVRDTFFRTPKAFIQVLSFPIYGGPDQAIPSEIEYSFMGGGHDMTCIIPNTATVTRNDVECK